MNQYRKYFSTGAGLCVDPNSLLLKQLDKEKTIRLLLFTFYHIIWTDFYESTYFCSNIFSFYDIFLSLIWCLFFKT